MLLLARCYWDEMGGACSTCCDREEFEGPAGKFEGERPVGLFKSRWENNIKMDVNERDWKVVDRIQLSQDKLL
jgi:hypothetical protein